MAEFYDLKSFKEEIISPKEFMKRYQNSEENINNAEFVQPKFGSKHFGKFKIKHKTPYYKYVKCKKT